MLSLIIPWRVFHKSFDDNWFSEGWLRLDPQVGKASTQWYFHDMSNIWGEGGVSTQNYCWA